MPLSCHFTYRKNSYGLIYGCCLDFKKESQSPHRLTKGEVAEHLRQYATDFHLNVISSAVIQSTIYNPSEKKWTVKLKTANGKATKTIISKHFVQATGLGSGRPHIPPMKGEHLYRDFNLHSTQYCNAQLLEDQGVKVR